MSKGHNPAKQKEEFSTLAIGFTFVAATFMIAVGFFFLIYGITALLFSFGPDDGSFLHMGPTLWAACIIGLGALSTFAGGNLFVGRFWARMVACTIAAVILIASLLSFSTAPVWAVVLIVLNAFIIWAVGMHGDELAFD